MNTMLAPRIGFSLLPRDAWVVAGGVLVLLAAVSLAPDAAYAQDVAAIPAASGETMNSLLGRIAPATLAAAPRVTVEHERVLDDERAPSSRTGLDAYGRPLVELGGVTYRWWVNRGASNFGVGVGALGYVVPPTEPGGAQSLAYSSSVLTLGWRYQVDDHSTVFADASGARRFDADTNDRYSGKVGVAWKARTNKFGLDGASRSVALQLDSGYKMSLRVRRNGVGVYVKGQF